MNSVFLSRRPVSHPVRWPWLLFALVILALPSQTFSDAPRALPPGRLPDDQRLAPLKDLDGYFPFSPPRTAAGWTKRAERVRRQILVSLGLWPLPTKTPLDPVIHGKIERDGYTVERVYFQSSPGLFVTGSLYRPAGKTGPFAAVLCPHGHWSDGRFYDNEKGVRQEIVQGAERFENGGRSPLQARCVQLARMGCVVFHYDMIGYADSQQISYEIAHRFAKQRPEMNSTENWGLFSPQAEAHLQSVMGLQTWNSIRALDFVLSLPDVDSTRVGVTGASGGGTQTFILCAIDSRPTVSFPAVMVSTAMQGGCTCENACDLRVGTGNIEFAALFAPKPQGLTAADDWTKEMPTKGFPELKQHYQFLGAPKSVMLKPLLHFGHNYNYVSRAALYSWLNQHLKLGLTDPIVEEDYRRLNGAEMTVWDDAHPKPPGGPDFERQLLRQLHDDTQKQLRAATASPEEFRRIAGGGIDVVIGRTLAEAGDVEWDMKDKEDAGNYFRMTGLLRNTTYHEELPIVFLYPKEWNGQSVIWLDPAGKAGLFNPGADKPVPIREVQALLDRGATVIGVDLLYQGEFLADAAPPTQTRRVKNPREAAAYTFGYNHSLLAQRVHDVLTVLSYLKGHEPPSKSIDLVGFGITGPIAAAARAQAGQAIDRAVIDTGGFRFGKVAEIQDMSFLPGGAKYGDVPGLLALAAPAAVYLVGEGAQGPELVRSMYQRAGASEKLVAADGGNARSKAVSWLATP